MDVRRVAELYNPHGQSGGTAYLIGKDVIVTAYHVINPQKRTEDLPSEHLYDIRFIGDYDQGREEWITEGCCLCWHNQELDIALLKLVNGKPQFLSSEEPSDVRFGQLEYKTVSAQGTGFPRVQKYENRSNPEPLQGNLSGLAGKREKLLRLQVTSLLPDKPEDWGGISGTALFVDDVLVGVIVETNKGFREKALWATPISAVANDLEFCSLVLGESDRPLNLERVWVLLHKT